MFIRSALLSLSALAAAREMPKDEVKAAELYDTGIRHANNVALKKVCLTRASLYFNAALTIISGTLGNPRSRRCLQLGAIC